MTLSGGHADAVYSVAWSNDGSLIATGSADRTVCEERRMLPSSPSHATSSN